MKKRLTPRLVIARWLLAIMLSMSGCLIPVPAKAFLGFGDTVTDSGAYLYFAEMLVSLGGILAEAYAIVEGLVTVDMATRTAGAGVTSAIGMQAKSDAILAQELADDGFRRDQVNFAEKVAAENPETLRATQVLCRKQRGKLVEEYSRQAAQGSARALQEGWAQHNRNFDQGNGVGYTADAIGQTCGAGTNGGGGFGRLEDEWPDENCYPQTGTEAEKASRRGANINGAILSFDVTREALEEPKKETRTMGEGAAAVQVEVYVPDASKNQQQLFAAARDYCYNAAGPMIKPPHGKALSTSEGKTRMVAYMRCAALKSRFMDQCFSRITEISRPDCTDPSKQDACTLYHQKCADAIELGLTLPTSFGNCEQAGGPGLSLRQVEWLNMNTCKQAKELLTLKGAQATDLDLYKIQMACTDANQTWENKLAVLENSLNESLAAVYASKDCNLVFQ